MNFMDIDEVRHFGDVLGRRDALEGHVRIKLGHKPQESFMTDRADEAALVRVMLVHKHLPQDYTLRHTDDQEFIDHYINAWEETRADPAACALGAEIRNRYNGRRNVQDDRKIVPAS